MSNSQPPEMRIYREFRNDWSSLPTAVQNDLATFLVRLQQNPHSAEADGKARRDGAGRLSFEFSQGYFVYWQITSDEVQMVGTGPHIEVLAVVKKDIEVSKELKSEDPDENPPSEPPDILHRVYSRNASLGIFAMWGSLHASQRTGQLRGWIVDSWSQGGPPYLSPKIHWVSLPDYKLHHMRLDVGINSKIEIGPEDTDTESERLIFVRATLTQWEQDWAQGKTTA